jgi:hypothetical protein
MSAGEEVDFRHCERSEAIQSHEERLDCFVAALLAMTAKTKFNNNKESENA